LFAIVNIGFPALKNNTIRIMHGGVLVKHHALSASKRYVVRGLPSGFGSFIPSQKKELPVPSVGAGWALDSAWTRFIT
jgi:hypothetical protein